jgi:uroporphyrin-III C-methyltransferase / precorrin-2 dehydrogenase / sirohydrochlorin ferrochelatase
MGEGARAEGLGEGVMPAPARLFPLFLKLAGRRVLLVGGGAVACAKLPALLEAGAQVTVVAPEIRSELKRADVRVERRPFRAADLQDVWLCISAAPPEVNQEVVRAAEARCVFVNAVDDVSVATAYTAGVVRKDGVTLAVSTEGTAPALTGLLREALEALLPKELERWRALAQSLRAEWKAQKTPMAHRRPLLLEALNRLYAKRGADEEKAA